MIRFFLIISALCLGAAMANETNKSAITTDYSNCLLLKDKNGEHYFLSEMAFTSAKRQRGMMFRDELKESHAMLFAFKEPKALAFWMKNVKIPLDMLFFDQYGNLNEIKSNVLPCHSEVCPTYPAQHNNNSFVLEIKGGAAEKLHIVVGATLRGTEKSLGNCHNET